MSKVKIGRANNSNIIIGDVVHTDTSIQNDNKQIADIAVEIENILASYQDIVQHAEVAKNVVRCIDQNDSLSKKIIKSIKDGSIDALSQTLNHPAASFIIGAIKSWKEQRK